MMTDTACTKNHISPKERLCKLLKESHARNSEKNSQNNIA